MEFFLHDTFTFLIFISIYAKQINILSYDQIHYLLQYAHTVIPVQCIYRNVIYKIKNNSSIMTCNPKAFRKFEQFVNFRHLKFNKRSCSP